MRMEHGGALVAAILVLLGSLLLKGTFGQGDTLSRSKGEQVVWETAGVFTDSCTHGESPYRLSKFQSQQAAGVSTLLTEVAQILETSSKHREIWIHHSASEFRGAPKSDREAAGASTDDDMLSKFVFRQPKSQQSPSKEVLEAPGILFTLSEAGLTYVKEELVNQILSEITPLYLPDIQTRVNSPIGHIDTEITDIVLSGANVSYSDIDLGKTGITVFAEDIRASLGLHWKYEYSASYIPFPIGDGGRADVQVTGLQAGVTFTLKEENGTLRLAVVECGTYIDNLDIELHGGASWLYQWFVYAFEDEIRAVIEEALTATIVSGVEQLDSFLLGLPRRVPIDETAAIDVTIVEDPLVSPTYLSVGVKAQFVSLVNPVDYPQPDQRLPAGLSCSDSLKMVTIATSDYVINSAAAVYYEAGYLEWLVDKLPEQSLLNTASWRFIIPQLYKKYPNDDMVLDFAVSAAPQVELSKDGARVVAAAEMTILVLTKSGSVPVACISTTVSMDAIASLVANNITAEASLNDLILELKWSDVGKFPVKLVQTTVRTLLSKVILPLLNRNLKRGFPLPILPAVDLQDADIRYEDGYILICSNVYYKGGYLGMAGQSIHPTSRIDKFPI